MKTYLSVKTDLRVHDIVKYFEGTPGWTIIHEIDSLNFGEGYDLDYVGVRVRLFDDERSDEVLAHPKFKIGNNWDEIFAEVQKRMTGQVSLHFEINRHLQANQRKATEAVLSIIKILKSQGLEVTEDKPARPGGAAEAPAGESRPLPPG
jgi:hypothetical protein